MICSGVRPSFRVETNLSSSRMSPGFGELYFIGDGASANAGPQTSGDRVYLLLLKHHALVGGRCRPEGELRNEVQSRGVLLGVGIAGHLVGDREPRGGRDGPLDLLLWLDGSGERVGAARPTAPVLLYQGLQLVRLHVAGDEDGRVLRAVKSVEELAGVGVLIGHGLDVGQEAHW